MSSKRSSTSSKPMLNRIVVSFTSIDLRILSESSEDGACRMNGERTVVEEVGGAMDELQIVQKTEAGFLVLQVDADHGSRSFSKLALRQLVIRIILQTNIVY